MSLSQQLLLGLQLQRATAAAAAAAAACCSVQTWSSHFIKTYICSSVLLLLLCSNMVEPFSKTSVGGERQHGLLCSLMF
jgi:hypothetical protein